MQNKRAVEMVKRFAGVRSGLVACVLLLAALPAAAAVPASWTPTPPLNANSKSTTGATATTEGVTITVSGLIGSTTNNTYGYGTAPALEAEPTAGAWYSNPYDGVVSGRPALSLNFGFVDQTTVRTLTVTFSMPVDNPVLFVADIGAQSGTTYSTIWKLTGSAALAGANTVTATRLSGNTNFLVGTTAPYQFNEVIGQASQGTGAGTCVQGNAGCGAIQFNGAGITSLTFDVTHSSPSAANLGDLMLINWSLPDTKVQYRKQSVGGTASFGLSGTNGVGATTLNTATSNPTAYSTAYAVTDLTQPTTITEPTVPAGYTLQSTSSCVNQGGQPVTSTIDPATRTLTLPPFTSASARTISCTLVNRILDADLLVTKTNTPGVNGEVDQAADRVVSGATTTYDVVITNNGPDSADGTTVRDTPGTGLTAANWPNIFTAGGVAIPTLPNGGSVTFKVQCTVN